jgi:hypothetical protein
VYSAPNKGEDEKGVKKRECRLSMALLGVGRLIGETEVASNLLTFQSSFEAASAGTEVLSIHLDVFMESIDKLSKTPGFALYDRQSKAKLKQQRNRLTRAYDLVKGLAGDDSSEQQDLDALLPLILVPPLASTPTPTPTSVSISISTTLNAAATTAPAPPIAPIPPRYMPTNMPPNGGYHSPSPSPSHSHSHSHSLSGPANTSKQWTYTVAPSQPPVQLHPSSVYSLTDDFLGSGFMSIGKSPMAFDENVSTFDMNVSPMKPTCPQSRPIRPVLSPSKGRRVVAASLGQRKAKAAEESGDQRFRICHHKQSISIDRAFESLEC